MLNRLQKAYLDQHLGDSLDALFAHVSRDSAGAKMPTTRKEVRAYVADKRGVARALHSRADLGALPESPAAPALHLKPLPFKMPPKGKLKQGLQSWVIIPDVHLPFEDSKALAVVAQIIVLLDPYGIIQLGDLMDAYSLSRFPKDPRMMVKLQEEVDKARALLGAWRLLAPSALMVLLEGNHSFRMRRTLWESPPAAQALLTLNAVSEAMTWPKLLGLEELRITHVPYGELYHLPKMVVKHGDIVRSQAAYTAAAEHRKEGISGISGHTHRMGLFASSDHNGAQTWIEAGHLCDLAKMDYVKRPNWQQGCTVVTFDPETGANAIEFIRIQNGKAVFRDHLIDCSRVAA
jgi:hypothetical protein